MNQVEFQRNHLQMDYYSESYQDFERDFYRYSNMNIPLTFLTDDILKTMATSRKNYFVLNKERGWRRLAVMLVYKNADNQL